MSPAKDLFIRQCDCIKVAFNAYTIVMGNFNLDYSKRHDITYSNAELFALFDERVEDLNLIQLVIFKTWTRMVGSVVRSSTLNYIYVNNVTLLKNVTHVTPILGDHELIIHLSFWGECSHVHVLR